MLVQTPPGVVAQQLARRWFSGERKGSSEVYAAFLADLERQGIWLCDWTSSEVESLVALYQPLFNAKGVRVSYSIAEDASAVCIGAGSSTPTSTLEKSDDCYDADP